MGIIKQPCMFLPEIMGLRAVRNAMPLITHGTSCMRPRLMPTFACICKQLVCIVLLRRLSFVMLQRQCSQRCMNEVYFLLLTKMILQRKRNDSYPFSVIAWRPMLIHLAGRQDHKRLKCSWHYDFQHLTNSHICC